MQNPKLFKKVFEWQKYFCDGKVLQGGPTSLSASPCSPPPLSFGWSLDLGTWYNHLIHLLLYVYLYVYQ